MTNTTENRRRLIQLKKRTALTPLRAYSALFLTATMLALALLAGCASPPMGGGGPDPLQYNAQTDYPAVGSRMSYE